MIGFGSSARHWQQIGAGRPITVTTRLRICEVFDISMLNVMRGLDAGIYETPSSPDSLCGNTSVRIHATGKFQWRS